ncbi:FGGY-family carbohydrate kinase [Citrobacter sp. FDAARGOS_156]|uniref:FGGY-family carbohydrate kinase n=2 Tax=unclassified Citrobacter TaxID=2644389 RepID=UPI000A6AB182
MGCKTAAADWATGWDTLSLSLASRHLANTPAVAKAYQAGTLVFGTVDSWLLWHLAQEKKSVTTPTNATSAGAYCLKEHHYHLPWLQTLGFPASLLPELHDDADDFGTTHEDILGISVPILACAGDQFAGAIGLGCTERGQAFCMHGTGSFVDLMMGPTVPTLQKGCESTLTMTARRQKGLSHFSVETFVPTTGSALNWVCEKLHWFDSPEQISELAAQASDAGGVSFIPALTGLRVPHLQPHARASLNGISISTTRSQVAYAILEGIAHSVAACIRANEAATGIPTKELVVGEGYPIAIRYCKSRPILAVFPCGEWPKRRGKLTWRCVFGWCRWAAVGLAAGCLRHAKNRAAI